MPHPYNLRWKKKIRQEGALERLQKRIKALFGATQSVDVVKRDKAVEEAAILVKKIAGSH